MNIGGCMKNQIVIVGTGGWGREVSWLIERINQVRFSFEILGFIDENLPIGTKVENYYVLGNLNSLKKYNDQMNVCIAIGNPKTRKRVVNDVTQLGRFKFPNLIDPSAIVDSNKLGFGNVICAQSVFTVNYCIGNFCNINLACTIGHDVVINSFVSMHPGVNVAGNVTIGACSEIGTGTSINQGLLIGENTVIGASAAVISNIEDFTVNVGVPAKKIKKSET